MSILVFDKPKKSRPSKTNDIYVPNMSAKDMSKWKAKKISGKDRRIEIRKSVYGFDPIIEKQRASRGWSDGKSTKSNASAQILMIVRPDCSVVMSANGRMVFDEKTWHEMEDARKDAIMELIKDEK